MGWLGPRGRRRPVSYIGDPPTEPYGCGYEWDHTIPTDTNVCTECDAEIFDDEDGEPR